MESFQLSEPCGIRVSLPDPILQGRRALSDATARAVPTRCLRACARRALGISRCQCRHSRDRLRCHWTTLAFVCLKTRIILFHDRLILAKMCWCARCPQSCGGCIVVCPTEPDDRKGFTAGIGAASARIPPGTVLASDPGIAAMAIPGPTTGPSARRMGARRLRSYSDSSCTEWSAARGAVDRASIR